MNCHTNPQLQLQLQLREAIKKMLNFGHCPNLRDPLLPKVVWMQKGWTLRLRMYPPSPSIVGTF